MPKKLYFFKNPKLTQFCGNPYKFKKRVSLKLNALLPRELFSLEKYISNYSAMFVFLPQYLDIQIFVDSLQCIALH